MANNEEEQLIPDELAGKVLVAKVGVAHEDFINKLNEGIKIAQGPLGWRGHAELLHSLDAIPELKGMTVEEVESFVKQAYLQGLYEVAEWIPEEEAEKRRQTTETLYGEPEVPSKG